MATPSNKRRDIRTSLSCPVYYSDGHFHASGIVENLTNRGGRLHGTHLVKVGMELMMLLIPPAKHALIVRKATVRWVDNPHFGVELNEGDCGAVVELGDVSFQGQQGPMSIMSQ